MAAKFIQSGILSDDHMRSHLASGKGLVFEGFPGQWKVIEHQVKRLGFGNNYFVTRTRGRHGDLIRVTPALNPAVAAAPTHSW
jgi:hypothetical protein